MLFRLADLVKETVKEPWKDVEEGPHIGKFEGQTSGYILVCIGLIVGINLGIIHLLIMDETLKRENLLTYTLARVEMEVFDCSKFECCDADQKLIIVQTTMDVDMILPQDSADIAVN